LSEREILAQLTLNIDSTLRVHTSKYIHLKLLSLPLLNFKLLVNAVPYYSLLTPVVWLDYGDR